MTSKEAQQTLNAIKFMLDNDQYSDDVEEALDIAIEALKKSDAKKPKRIITNKNIEGNFVLVCPSCGWLMFKRVTTHDESYPTVDRIRNYCNSCGQSIDWSDYT